MQCTQVGQTELQATAKRAAFKDLEDHLTNLTLANANGEPRSEAMALGSTSHPTLETPSTRMQHVGCVVCMENEKNVVLLPCTHLCLCKGCTKKIMSSCTQALCPVCREPIAQTIKVFM